jgi:hypothetical protein
VNGEEETSLGEPFDQGLREFNAAHFYEAHEIWEEQWTEEVGDRRRFLQGLIQAAAGYHKAEIGVPGGALKLFSMALRLLDEFPADAFGIRLDEFRQRLRADAASGQQPLSPPRIVRDR